MRYVVTGVDADGRSCVIENREPLTDRAVDVGTALMEDLWETAPAPFEVPVPRRAPGEETLELGFVPGGAKWILAYLKPNGEPFLHRTDTIDFDVVVQGDVTLYLDAEAVHLVAGDCVVLPGVVHGWGAGPDGCTLAVVGLGLPSVD
jgi:hypothetical protein